MKKIAFLIVISLSLTNTDNSFGKTKKFKRGVFVSNQWCHWEPWSTCSVTCGGKGITTRTRICQCKSRNIFKNVKNAIVGGEQCDDTKPDNQTDRRICQSYHLCPASSKGFPQIYWIIGGGIFGLILLCIFVWACVSAIFRKKKQVRFRTVPNREERQRSSQRQAHHQELSSSSVTFSVIPSAPRDANTDLPPSYDEATQSQMSRRSVSRSSTMRSNEMPPPRYSDVVTSAL